jgi:hypothetical protein
MWKQHCSHILQDLSKHQNISNKCHWSNFIYAGRGLKWNKEYLGISKISDYHNVNIFTSHRANDTAYQSCGNFSVLCFSTMFVNKVQMEGRPSLVKQTITQQTLTRLVCWGDVWRSHWQQVWWLSPEWSAQCWQQNLYTTHTSVSL